MTVISSSSVVLRAFTRCKSGSPWISVKPVLTTVGSEADAEGAALSRPGYGVELVHSVLAAVDLGFFHHEGVDVSFEILAPTGKTFAALRDGELDFVAGGASDTLSAFPGWRGAKLLAAVCQHVTFLLVVRKELGATRGDLNVVKGLRIGAGPGPDAVLKRILLAAGMEPDRDGVQIRGDVGWGPCSQRLVWRDRRPCPCTRPSRSHLGKPDWRLRQRYSAAPAHCCWTCGAASPEY